MSAGSQPYSLPLRYKMLPPEEDIFSEIVRLREKGIAFSMATIVSVTGSTPRSPGTRMLVLEDGRCIGTIGGGVLERSVKELCLKALSGGVALLKDFDLDGKDGMMACGGAVKVFIEPVLPCPRVFVLGSGHVADAFGVLASFCGLDVIALDQREAALDERQLSWARKTIHISRFLQAFKEEVPCRYDFVVIATGTHQDDLEAVRAALSTDASYIGLLGSKRKWTRFSNKLQKEGFSKDDLERVSCPAGLEIGAKGPREIAVSIVGEIIAKMRKPIT